METLALEKLSRDELVEKARALGVERPELMTRVELRDEIVRRSEPDPAEQRRQRGWLGVARDLVASVVESGLNLPDAAAIIRGGRPELELRGPPPVATVTLAQIYAAQGHTARALAVLDEVLEKEPDHKVARDLRERFARELAAGTRVPSPVPPPPSSVPRAGAAETELPAVLVPSSAAPPVAVAPSGPAPAETPSEVAAAGPSEGPRAVSGPTPATTPSEPSPAGAPSEVAAAGPSEGPRAVSGPTAAAKPSEPPLAAAPSEAVAVAPREVPHEGAPAVSETAPATTPSRPAPAGAPSEPVPALTLSEPAPEVTPSRPERAVEAVPPPARPSTEGAVAPDLVAAPAPAESAPPVASAPAETPPPGAVAPSTPAAAIPPVVIVVRAARRAPVVCWDIGSAPLGRTGLLVRCVTVRWNGFEVERRERDLPVSERRGQAELSPLEPGEVLRAALGVRVGDRFIPLAIASEIERRGGELAVGYRPPISGDAEPAPIERELAALAPFF